MKKENVKNKFRIGNVYISVTNPTHAEETITRAALASVNNYICVSNAYTVEVANKDNDYCACMNEAFMCLPDGIPLTWMAHLWGLKEVDRTDGPDLFISMLNKPESGIKHFLLGDTEETLNKIQAMFPNANIVGLYSPPFAPLEEYDLAGIARIINSSGANIVWVSLKAPKQDFFSKMLMPYLNGSLCIGVGAAFRFALGEYKHPPKIAQKLALTGFFWRKNRWSLFKDYCARSILLCKWGIQILWRRFFSKE